MMQYGIDNSEMIDIDRIFLDQENPRHEVFNSQEEAIEYLCNHEKIVSLAKDIVENGLNPLELFALIKERGNTYFSAEGNRRLCAIKLLNDPDLSPSKYRKDFEALSKNYSSRQSVFSVVFKDRDEVRLWLDRIHAGSDDGRGRKQWNAEQKSRNSTYSKNDFALTVLDVAQAMGLINAEEKKGRLSTVQRYVSNPLMRNALGLLVESGSNYKVNLAKVDFEIVLSAFIRDIKSREINTRDNAKKIIAYSNKLSCLEGFNGSRVSPYDISFFLGKRKENAAKDKSDLSVEPDASHQIDPPLQAQSVDLLQVADNIAEPEVPVQPQNIQQDEQLSTEQLLPSTPQLPNKPSKLMFNDKLQENLGLMSNYKLQSIYYSLCTIFLVNHTPMLYVGVWSFIESLTALDGRVDGTDFQSYFSKEKLISLGVTEKAEQRSVRSSLQRISEFGNSTKHHKNGAGFNSAQLANDFYSIQDILLTLTDKIVAQEKC